MEKPENVQYFEQALEDYLQPVFDEHFSLRTWAGIWAAENLGFGGEVYDNLLGLLPAVDGIEGTVHGFVGVGAWDAVCELSVSISLKGDNYLFSVMVDRGNIMQVELLGEDFSDEFTDLDLAAEFEKKLTWVTLSS